MACATALAPTSLMSATMTSAPRSASLSTQRLPNARRTAGDDGDFVPENMPALLLRQPLITDCFTQNGRCTSRQHQPQLFLLIVSPMVKRDSVIREKVYHASRFTFHVINPF
jgi:hypothetical protein